MRKYQCLLFVLKRSSTCHYMICMAVPLIILYQNSSSNYSCVQKVRWRNFLTILCYRFVISFNANHYRLGKQAHSMLKHSEILVKTKMGGISSFNLLFRFVSSFWDREYCFVRVWRCAWDNYMRDVKNLDQTQLDARIFLLYIGSITRKLIRKSFQFYSLKVLRF